MARVHGSQPHPATCDKLATRDTNRTHNPSARTLPPICALRGSNRLLARHRTDQGGLLRWKGSLGPLSLSLAPAFAVWFELATGFFEGVRRIGIQLCGAAA